MTTKIRSTEPTLRDSPLQRTKRETTDPWVGHSSPLHGRPWTDPPEITPEMEALADAFDEGGRELIAEVEG